MGTLSSAPGVPEFSVIPATFSALTCIFHAAPSPGEGGPGEGAVAHSMEKRDCEGVMEEAACSVFSQALRSWPSKPELDQWGSPAGEGDAHLLWVLGSCRHLGYRPPALWSQADKYKHVALGDW